MNKSNTVDINSVNKLIKILNKIMKNIHVLILFLTIYITILILKKLQILYYLTIVFDIFAPLFMGILIAWLIRPIINYLERYKFSRILSLVIIYLVMILIVYVCFVNFIPIFAKEFNEFIKVFPKIIESFLNNISFFGMKNLKTELLSIINDFIIKLGRNMPLTFINIFKGVSSFLISLIISFYLLKSSIILSINSNLKKDTYELILKINNILRNYVKGTLLSSFIVFLSSTIIFYILDFDNSFFLGFICGITNIIPFIGPYIGGIIPCLISFTKSTTFGILITVIIFIIQLIEGNIVHPIIMSKSINMHPVISIMSVIVFGYFLGIFGMIFAIPLVASIKEVYYYSKNRYKNIIK